MTMPSTTKGRDGMKAARHRTDITQLSVGPWMGLETWNASWKHWRIPYTGRIHRL